jgi:hypothetical protein
MQHMKKGRIILILLFISMFAVSNQLAAQCSICTKTSMQQGEKPAAGMNSAIIYLMLAPFAVVGYVGYRWWKGTKEV